jgi:hypothetical protein
MTCGLLVATRETGFVVAGMRPAKSEQIGAPWASIASTPRSPCSTERVARFTVGRFASAGVVTNAVAAVKNAATT